MFGPGGSFFVWVGGMNGGRDERTVCQRGGCMVVPGAVVSPGHTKRLSLLPCRAPHVIEVKNDRIVIGIGNTVTAAVNAANLAAA